MANSLSVAGNTRISWSLSDADAQPQVSMSAQRSSARAITNGTGPNQATVAFTTALTITAPPGGTYFSTETAAAAPLLRAVVRNTGIAQAAIALTVSAVVLAP